MLITLQNLYAANWLWLVWFLLAGILGFTSSYRGRDAVFKTIHYYLYVLIAVQIFVPVSHLSVREILFDLISRFYLVVNTAELFWIECSQPVSPGHSVGPTDASGKSAGKAPPPHSGFPRTYSLRILYGSFTVVFLGWMLLGLAFIHF